MSSQSLEPAAARSTANGPRFDRMVESPPTTVSASRAPVAAQRHPASTIRRPPASILRTAAIVAAGGDVRTSPRLAASQLRNPTAAVPRESVVRHWQGSIGNAAVQRAVQRHCGSPTGCPGCREAHAAIAEIAQRKAAGSALPPPTRSLMESRMGADFGDVRTHTDDHAADSADRLGARAFTMGKDVFFGRGQFDPHSQSGQGLIAHELTHVIQQRSGRAPASGLDTPGDAYEQEAEAVSRKVASGETARVAGTAVPSVVQRAPRPPLTGRMVKDTYTAPGPLIVPGLKVSNRAGDQGHVEGLYSDFVSKKRLRSTHAGRSREGRKPTDDLWDKWAKTRAFLGPTAQARDAQVSQLRKVKKCQVDHVIELQVGGPDDPSNMRLLSGKRNVDAGFTMAREINTMLATVRQQHQLPGDSRPILVFESVKVEDGSEDRDCLDYELDAEVKAGKPHSASGTKELRFLIGLTPAFLGYWPSENGRVDHTSQYVVPGFELKRVTKEDPYEITADISPYVKRIPVLQLKQYLFSLKSSDDGQLVLSGDKYLKTVFPFLSEAQLAMDIDSGELRANGVLKPSLPLLRFIEIQLKLEKQELTGTASVPPDKLARALPIPGLTITAATLGITFGQGRFAASGGFSVKYGTIADGQVQAKFTDAGFEAVGTLTLHIPGVDEAKGELWIKQGRLGGRIEVSASKIKIPGVKDANLVVLVQDGALRGDGVVHLGVPGVKEGRLGFGVDQSGDYSITGTAALSIPRLKDPSLSLTLRNGDIEGAAHTGLEIPGLEQATFDVLYAKGKLTGAGRVSYKKGKLSGVVTLALSEEHRLSGGGELGYEIAPGLVAFAGMQITPAGDTKVSGGLRVPETIDIFARKQVEKELFKLPTIEIPILAIPLGTHSVGIVATIDAGLIARAGVGPGQLQKVKMLGELDPSSDAAAFSFQASAELHVPASAELALSIAGGIGVSVAIARAVGGIEAEGAAGLAAEFMAGVDLRYQSGQFSVAGVAELRAQPRLAFRVRAFVRAEADLFVTTIELYRKEWLLKEFEAGSALQVGVRVPFVYVFGQPFDLRLDQVQFIVPKIDAASLMKELLPL